MRDVVTDADDEEWAAQAQATLRQQYAEYEKGLATEYGAEEAHRVAEQARRDHWAVLRDYAQHGIEREMYELG